MVTRNDIKVNYLNIDIDNETYDAIIDYYIDLAEGIINEYCGQSIKQTTTDYYFKFSGEEKRIPFTNVTLLNHLYERGDYNNDWVEVDGVLFFDSQPKIGYSFDGYYKANITYGYTTIPYEIQRVAAEMVYIMFNNGKVSDGSLRDTIGVSQVATTIDTLAGTIQIKEMQTSWKATLSKYKKLYD